MEMVELEKHIEILSGYAFDSKLFNDKGLGKPIIRIRDIGKEKSNTFFNGDYDERFLIKAGDFLIGMDGDFRLAKWEGEESLLNQRVCKIRSKNKEKLNDDYLLRLLPRELKFIEDSTSFATVKHLSVKKINSIQLPLPPLPTQKKIAAILDEADQLRQLDKKLIDKYDALTQSLFLEMFGDPVSNPKGWETKEIQKLIVKIEKLNKNSEFEQIEYVDISSIDNKTNIITYTTNYLFDERPSRAQQIINKGDVLLSTVRPNLKNIALNHMDGLIGSTGFFVFRVNEKITNRFLFELLKSQSITDSFINITSGANYPALSTSDLKKYKIVIPPISLQTQFAQHIQIIESQKALAQQSLQKSEDLFNSLLQKAFKGDLVI